MTTTLSPREVAPSGTVKVPHRLRSFNQLLEYSSIPCEVVLPSGDAVRHGTAPSEFWVRIKSERAFGRGLDKLAISSHYSLGDDFYLNFIDQRWRFYSHGIFRREDESIEEASEHKLERMFSSLELKPGMRLLDIGAGLRELLYHGMDLIDVQNETRDYDLTMRQWAERFDAAREEIIARWGERIYRSFRLYLWGGSRTLTSRHTASLPGGAPNPVRGPAPAGGCSMK